MKSALGLINFSLGIFAAEFLVIGAMFLSGLLLAAGCGFIGLALTFSMFR